MRHEFVGEEGRPVFLGVVEVLHKRLRKRISRSTSLFVILVEQQANPFAELEAVALVDAEIHGGDAVLVNRFFLDRGSVHSTHVVNGHAECIRVRKGPNKFVFGSLELRGVECKSPEPALELFFRSVKFAARSKIQQLEAKLGFLASATLTDAYVAVFQVTMQKLKTVNVEQGFGSVEQAHLD